MYTFLKKSVLTSTVSLFLGSFVLSNPSQAASVNFTKFFGDVTTSGGQTSLTNAFDASDDASVNYNVSGNTPGLADNLESFLGVTLGGNPQEGSAVRTTLAASAGDVFSFDWVFRTNDSLNNDYAFVTIGSQVFNLANITNATIPGSTLGNNPNPYLRQTNNNTFSYTFNTAGTYNVGIGVVDVNDFVTSSGLSVRNANTQPVPEPLTILGSGIAAGFGVILKRKQAKKV
ncbi:hypothetical protein NIES4075_43700 [Tolypothrix sp. NIES-4075]|uniref:PEP-CTERM sorting domain-containing protein n=1 Tax=Tolypothrix sp. NIES-4075 TaxID=2005459 RepID=UPI000B5CD591|nr:PEP-CTERM sorting domain-containing protein [Tolypothrix sp. NIES-4075]GAX43357.1 hypothetical protein NIES4075_43700 [Tolypothrix sp. NIES-4075]